MKATALSFALLALSIAFEGCGGSGSIPSGSLTQTDTSSKKALILVFENADYSQAIQAPFFKEFAARGVLYTNSHGVIHPSQGNYIALAAGDSYGITSDANMTLKVSNLADLLEAAGKTWKVYAEGYPGNCFLGGSSGNYARKHVPFISFADIQNAPSRCAKIVNASEFAKDVASDSVPDYALYVPDLKNDGHDTGVTYASNWFQTKFRPLLDDPNFMRDRLVVATFDEGSSSSDNHIYTAMVGAGITAGRIDNTHYDHYSLVRMLEDLWGLGSFGRKDASGISFSPYL